MNKSQLRVIERKLRVERDSKTRRMLSSRIQEGVLTYLRVLPRRKVIHLFLSVPELGEVETAPILTELQMEFPSSTFVVPRCTARRGVFESVVISSGTVFTKNKFGVPEPTEGEILPPSAVEVALVPLLCADKRGHRIGFGEGYYDRFLEAAKNAHAIGLSFEEPVEVIDDVGAHDQRLAALVTPWRVYAF